MDSVCTVRRIAHVESRMSWCMLRKCLLIPEQNVDDVKSGFSYFPVQSSSPQLNVRPSVRLQV